MSSLTLDERLRQADEAADLYEATVHALLTFAAFVTHDGKQRRPDAFFGFGRRMDIRMTGARDDSASTGDSDDAVGHSWIKEVTPDLVAQKSTSYGIVAEVKAGLADGDHIWDDYTERLETYDTDLAGWWTGSEEIALSDALLLVHRSRSRRLVRALEERLADGRIQPSKRTAVVDFVRSDQVDTYYSFRLEWGALDDEELGDRLDDSVEVPLGKVIREFAAIQFYDAEPPLPVMLEILWVELFGRVAELEYDESTKSWPLGVKAQATTLELQRAYGSRALHQDERSCEFPKPKWVRRALDTLVRLEMAKELDDAGEYLVWLKPVEGGDLRSEFVRRIHAKRKGKTEENVESLSEDQTSLPLSE